MNATILLVDDEPSLRRVMQVHLQQSGYQVFLADSGEGALDVLAQEKIDLIVTDLRMAGTSGLDLLAKVQQLNPELPVILVTAYGTVETAVAAMKSGAYDFVTKPVNLEQLKLSVVHALENRRLKFEVAELRRAVSEKFGFGSIVGRSRALMEVLDLASRAAQTDSTVMIHGETGSGKELIARALHLNSRRRNQPFVTINCGAIPRELMQSELFGHVKGSFTGAVADKQGRVEHAEGGTLFLDEVGELALELQVKLLRLLQEREIEKVGGAMPIKVDVRVIAATHRNLSAMVEDGLFREDLYYRLTVIPLELPSLRERSDDIPLLLTHFWKKSTERHGRADLELPQELVANFSGFSWPGNIRQLENVVERVVVLARHNPVELSDLPEFLQQTRRPLDAIELALPPEGISLEAVERELIQRALERFSGNQTQAAKYLDISRKTLIYRMEKYGLA